MAGRVPTACVRAYGFLLWQIQATATVVPKFRDFLQPVTGMDTYTGSVWLGSQELFCTSKTSLMARWQSFHEGWMSIDQFPRGKGFLLCLDLAV